MKYSFFKISLIIVIATATAWQCIGAWQDSQTTDEAVHLVSGLSYWQTGSFVLNPEHPALFKLWASWPLLLLPEAHIPTYSETWQTGNQWSIGAQYLHYSTIQQRYGSQFLMLMGRMPMILLWLGLVLTVAWWSWKRWGPAASLAATTLLAYDPNFLGHGHLVTNDVPLAFAYLGTFLCLRKTIAQPNWKNVVVLSIVFALAQLTKFSAVALWIIVPVVMAIATWYRLPNWRWRWMWRSLVTIVATSLVMSWMVYGFQVNRISQDPHIAELWQVRQKLVDTGTIDTVPPLIQLAVRLADPSTLTGQIMERLQHWHIPAYYYWRGFFSAQSHSLSGHGAFLMGQLSDVGWWYYFPIALLVKTPTLLLFVVALFSIGSIGLTLARWRHYRRPIVPLDFWFLGFPPLAFLAFSMLSHINIGVRHVFPTYVFFPLAVGALVAWLQLRHRRLGPTIALAVGLGAIIVGTAAWPNTIGYFNGLVGGTAQGHRYLSDSNLDWNQDLWRLRSFLTQQQAPIVRIALFGSIPNNVVFPDMQAIPTDAQIRAGVQPSDLVCISAYHLYIPDSWYTWLRSYQARWRIGSSIHCFDFR